MAKCGDAPAARTGDLRDQSVDVKAVEESADLGTLRWRVLTKVARELCAEIAVRESMHGVLAAHEGEKELTIRAGHGIEGRDGPPDGRPFARRDRVETPQAGRGSSTWAKALRYRELLCREISR